MGERRSQPARQGLGLALRPLRATPKPWRAGWLAEDATLRGQAVQTAIGDRGRPLAAPAPWPQSYAGRRSRDGPPPPGALHLIPKR